MGINRWHLWLTATSVREYFRLVPKYSKNFKTNEMQAKGEGGNAGTTTSVFDWLQSVGLEELYDNFVEHEVHEEEAFLQLSMKDFPGLGINTLDGRRKLFSLLSKLKGQGTPVTSSPSSMNPLASVKLQQPARRSSMPNQLGDRTKVTAVDSNKKGRNHSFGGSGLKVSQTKPVIFEDEPNEEDENENEVSEEDEEDEILAPAPPPTLKKQPSQSKGVVAPKERVREEPPASIESPKRG